MSVRQEISFVVVGVAQSAGSKRAITHRYTGKTVVIDDAKGSGPWKKAVAAAALEVKPAELLEGPLMLRLSFVFERPKGHYGRGRNAGVLLPSAPREPSVRPDLTKLTRAVEDALTKVIWADDAQVTRQILSKSYGPVAGVKVNVCELPLEELL